MIGHGEIAYAITWLQSHFERAELTTTDATVTDAIIVPMGNDTTLKLEVHAVAIQSGGANSAGYVVHATFNKDGAAAPVIVGVYPENAHWKEDDTSWGGISFAIATPSIKIQVTGKAATTINWKVLAIKLDVGI